MLKNKGTQFGLNRQILNLYGEHRKEKLSENMQVNFNHSKEIAYWAKKYNISPQLFQKVFEESGYSISRTLASFNQNLHIAN
jgi:hypothetical protein